MRKRTKREKERDQQKNPFPPSKAPPQLCVSFVISVAAKQPEKSSLLQFDEGGDEKVGKARTKPVCLELFGDGTHVGNGRGFSWSFIGDDDFREKESGFMRPPLSVRQTTTDLVTTNCLQL